MGYKGKSVYALKKLAPFAANTSHETVKKSLDILLDADINSKSTSVDPALLLTDVISRLCAAVEAG